MFFVVLFILLFLFVIPREVLAYIDPGSGSYLTQVILGFVFGGLFMVKVYWNKIKEVIFKRQSKSEKKENTKFKTS